MDAGGYNDTFSQLALSGEPPVPEVVHDIGTGPKASMPILEYFNLTQRLKDYRERYVDYWESTAGQTKSRRPVDAIIMPVAPHAAVIPGGNYFTYQYSSINDALDHCAIVIPVTIADQQLDQFDEAYEPLNEVDRENWLACKCMLLNIPPDFYV
jgi:amidase